MTHPYGFTEMGILGDDGNLVPIVRLVGPPYETETGTRRIGIQQINGDIVSAPLSKVYTVSLDKVFPYV